MAVSARSLREHMSFARTHSYQSPIFRGNANRESAGAAAGTDDNGVHEVHQSAGISHDFVTAPHSYSEGEHDEMGMPTHGDRPNVVQAELHQSSTDTSTSSSQNSDVFLFPSPNEDSAWSAGKFDRLNADGSVQIVDFEGRSFSVLAQELRPFQQMMDSVELLIGAGSDVSRVLEFDSDPLQMHHEFVPSKLPTHSQPAMNHGNDNRMIDGDLSLRVRDEGDGGDLQSRASSIDISNYRMLEQASLSHKALRSQAQRADSSPLLAAGAIGNASLDAAVVFTDTSEVQTQTLPTPAASESDARRGYTMVSKSERSPPIRRGRGRGRDMQSLSHETARALTVRFEPSDANGGRHDARSQSPAATIGADVRWTANSEAPAVLPSSLDGISGTNAGEEENGGEDETDNLAEIHGQFSNFIREAIDPLAERRCRALLGSFRKDQHGSEHALWINPDGIFQRVKVVGIADPLAGSPRVRISPRFGDFHLARFDEVFHDCPELEYQHVTQVDRGKIPMSMADGLARHMLSVHGERNAGSVNPLHDLVETEMPDQHEMPRDASPPGDEPGGDGDGESVGQSAGGWSRDNSHRGPKPHKFDTRKIDRYMGACEVAPRSDYTKRAAPWARRLMLELKKQTVPPSAWVNCALLCVDDIIAQDYAEEEMKVPGYPSDWELDELQYPPMPRSLNFRIFVKWLIKRHADPSLVELQRERYEQYKQKASQSTFLFNADFNYERQLLHELQLDVYLEDDDVEDASADSFPWNAITEKRDVLMYIGALRFDVKAPVEKWYTETKVLAGVMGNREMLKLLSLKNVQQVAIEFERTRRMHHSFGRNTSSSVPPSPARPLLAITDGRTGRADYRSRHRLNAHTVEDDEEDTSGEQETEHLYQKLVKSGRVEWSRGQIQKLMEEKRCFRCAQVGHRSPECKFDPVDPKSHKFNNLVEIDEFGNDMEILHALYELEEHGHPNGVASQ